MIFNLRAARRFVCWVLLACGLSAGSACRSARLPARRAAAELVSEQAQLARALRRLGPGVQVAEAERAAHVLVQAVEEARLVGRLEGGAVRRNLAVNLGLHDWGLCWHWTELLGRRLKEEEFRTLRLHWGCAHAGSTLREHNAVILTAPGQAFADGLVVDPWRKGGQLTWIRVAEDRYPWKHEPWSESRWLPANPATPSVSPQSWTRKL